MAEFQVMSVGTPDKIVGVISKLLTDLVARNDQARRALPPHRGPYCPEALSCPGFAGCRTGDRIHAHATRPSARNTFESGADLRSFLSRQLPLAPTQVTPFHSSKPPTIGVKSYLEDRCGPRPLGPPPAAPHRMRFSSLSARRDTVSRARRRILKYAGCSEETFILALIYMDQVRTRPARRGVAQWIPRAPRR